MPISTDLKEKFFQTIELYDVPWDVVDEVANSDNNIMRPIQGVCFETLFLKVMHENFSGVNVNLGQGDEDVDVYLEKKRLQLKTIDTNSTKEGNKIGVALHKTHGNEKRPYNLYKISERTFDYLVVLHPESGILIIPYDEIPESNSWSGYLSDPAQFDWDSQWLNRWDLLGFPDKRGESIESRNIPSKSELPSISKVTFLEDWEIVETLCNPSYFRAAVMGLKGNIKEHLIIHHLTDIGFDISLPDEAYPKHDFSIHNDREFKIQAKGTSKNMCDPDEEKIGVEIMGTHGQFPHRGYKKSYFDYVVIIVSEEQLNPEYPIEDGWHYVFIPTRDLPLHYLIREGIQGQKHGWANEKWNLQEYNDVIYPNIKLKTRYNDEKKTVEVYPDISSYRAYKGHETIPVDSPFRNAGPYVLDEIPLELREAIRN